MVLRTQWRLGLTNVAWPRGDPPRGKADSQATAWAAIAFACASFPRSGVMHSPSRDRFRSCENPFARTN
jgi:hypothetical protein